jgi:putative endonuclease
MNLLGRMNSTTSRGAAGEALAAAFLESRGLAIIARNLRCRGGELDLVCRDGALLIVVEVRQRSGLRFGGALASVTAAKQRKIIRATRFFLQRHAQYRDVRLRFDVLGVQAAPGRTPALEWIKDAFRAT